MRITLSTPLYIQELGKRSNQEDSYFMSEMTQTVTSPFFMVCDGMGGHDKGEVASALVCQSMSSFLTKQMGEGRAFDDTLFAEALDHTYAALDQLPIEGKRPGTTLTFLCCHRQGVTTANIGDSRIYHIRPKEGKVLFQSRDHSMVFDLYLMGELSFDEMATSPQKNVITKALMPGKENHHRADMVHIGDVQPDDCFLLCSDGMLEHITNDQLIDIFSHCDDMEKVRQMLIDASVDSADNHTAILLKVASVEQEEGVPVLDDERSSSCNALRLHRGGGHGRREETRQRGGRSGISKRRSSGCRLSNGIVTESIHVSETVRGTTACRCTTEKIEDTADDHHPCGSVGGCPCCHWRAALQEVAQACQPTRTPAGSDTARSTTGRTGTYRLIGGHRIAI